MPAIAAYLRRVSIWRVLLGLVNFVLALGLSAGNADRRRTGWAFFFGICAVFLIVFVVATVFVKLRHRGVRHG